MTYRPALDGIRAVCVAAVVAYHLGVDQLPGGFLGVDVFFVLSGYLITRLLLEEHASSGRIDLPRFWIRRARRLLPALFLVLLAVAVWVSWTSPAYELPLRRQNLFWALFYGSNWHLVASAQDYFASGASVSLVRHTWSLSIEEQFYLVWPVAVGVVLSLTRSRRALLWIAMVVTLSSAVWMGLSFSGHDPSRAYYGTDTRVHQVLIGALLAMVASRLGATDRQRRMAGTAAWAGAGVVIAAMVLLPDTSSVYYVGGSTFVAVAAAAWIWGVESHPSGRLARALGCQPARSLGRISYGVYLWHWPMILVVTQPASVLGWLPADVGRQVTVVVFTIALAALSFVLVERPIRERRVRFLPAATPRFGAVTVSAMALVAGSIALLTPSSSIAEDFSARGGARGLYEAGCEFGVCVRHVGRADAPVFAVVGDSIAQSLDAGFLEVARVTGSTYVAAASSGCRVTHLPTVLDAGPSEKLDRCYEAIPAVHEEVRARWAPDVVFVVQLVEASAFGSSDGRIVEPGTTAWIRRERRALVSFTGGFVDGGATVVFVETQPDVTPPRCLRDDALGLASCAIPANADASARLINRVIDDVVTSLDRDGVLSISLTDVLCPGGTCPPMLDGVVVRYDGKHYTEAGAQRFARIIWDRSVAAGAPLAA